MVSTTLIRKGLYYAGRIDKKYNINKIFIDKYFPPGYRKTAKQIVDIAGALGGGYGLYGFAQSLIAPDTPGNYAQIYEPRQFTQTRKSYQTRGGPASRYSQRRRTYCKPVRKYRYTNARRY